MVNGAIGSGLERCKAIIPVLTSKYISSRYCVRVCVCVRACVRVCVSHSVSISHLKVASFFYIGLGKGDDSDEGTAIYTCAHTHIHTKCLLLLLPFYKSDDPAHAPPTDVSAEPPLIGPSSTCIKPFKVIPDVPNPESITTTDEGNLIVTIMEHKVACPCNYLLIKLFHVCFLFSQSCSMSISYFCVSLSFFV